MAAHSGQVCDPLPHVRELLVTGNSLGAKEAAPEPAQAVPAVMSGVYLRCSAACQQCGSRSWRACEGHQVGKLSVIGPGGRVVIDRVAYQCETCTNVLAAGDPLAYITAKTFPATFAKVQTVFTVELLELLHRLRRVTPGLSSASIAMALPTELQRAGVRREWVARALNAWESMQAALGQSCGAGGPESIVKLTESAGVKTLVASDGMMKVRPLIHACHSRPRLCPVTTLGLVACPSHTHVNLLMEPT